MRSETGKDLLGLVQGAKKGCMVAIVETGLEEQKDPMARADRMASGKKRRTNVVRGTWEECRVWPSSSRMPGQCWERSQKGRWSLQPCGLCLAGSGETGKVCEQVSDTIQGMLLRG